MVKNKKYNKTLHSPEPTDPFQPIEGDKRAVASWLLIDDIISNRNGVILMD